jgi:hypothetical protein
MTSARKPLDWLHFVCRYGDDGIAWSERFKAQGHLKTLAAIPKALNLLRQRKIEAGRALLDKISLRIEPVAGFSPSSYYVLKRFQLAAEAYYHYTLEEYDEAHRALSEADRQVALMIEEEHFLMPLAIACKEFHLQHARISRNRRDWDQMWHHIGLARRMMHGDAPLCTLADGTAIDFAAIRGFYEALAGGLEADERDALSVIIDETRRVKDFERYLPFVYMPSQLIIPY